MPHGAAAQKGFSAGHIRLLGTLSVPRRFFSQRYLTVSEVASCHPRGGPCGRHHMSALLRLLSAGDASAAGSDCASASAPSIVSVAPCLEMTCRQHRMQGVSFWK